MNFIIFPLIIYSLFENMRFLLLKIVLDIHYLKACFFLQIRIIILTLFKKYSRKYIYTEFYNSHIINGSNVGKRVLTSRMEISPYNKRFLLKMVRKKLHVSTSFGMTINESQGQSIGQVSRFVFSTTRFHT